MNISAERGRFAWVVLTTAEPFPALKTDEGGEVEIHFQDGTRLRYDGIWLTLMSNR
jgi:hypothetical protein